MSELKTQKLIRERRIRLHMLAFVVLMLYQFASLMGHKS